MTYCTCKICVERKKNEMAINWWPKVPCGTRSMVMEALARQRTPATPATQEEG